MKDLQVLMIEDNEDDALLLLTELRQGGFNVVAERVESGERLKAALASREWDVIVSDFSLPSFSGLKALSIVKESGVDTPFILVSGTIGEEVAVDAMKAGAHDYIMKGKLGRLVPAIRRELLDAEVRRGRKAAEEALRKNEEQFRLITENVEDLIAVLDLEGRRVYNSPSYAKILGDPVSLLGTDSFGEIHPDDREGVKRVFDETVRSGIGQRSEYRFLKNDGGIRYIESQGSVIRDSAGKITNVLVVSRDITEKKKLEQQFLRAQRMESIGTLAGGIAHDLNNVLAPIMLSMQILRRKYKEEPDFKLLETIEAAAQRGVGMVKQVLTFARGGVEGQHVSLQVNYLINEIEKIIKETFPRSIRIAIHLPKGLWPVLGDATQLHQVLMNLCVNARDAMPNGGTLTLEMENSRIDEQYARMHTEARAGNYVMLSVSDTGSGIPPEIKDKIFEPFFTTKEIGKGTGLGLSTVQGIIRQHGGFIKVYSETGRGTKFQIYLPAQESDKAEGREEVKRRPLRHGKGELILIVDDEASIQEITKATLESCGYRTLSAGDGTEAVTIYVQHPTEVALVITDMMMPFMDGPATIQAIRKINPTVKIIATSGIGENEKVMKLSGNGVVFLQKPYTAETLLTTLANMLQGE